MKYSKIKYGRYLLLVIAMLFYACSSDIELDRTFDTRTFEADMAAIKKSRALGLFNHDGEADSLYNFIVEKHNAYVEGANFIALFGPNPLLPPPPEDIRGLTYRVLYEKYQIEKEE